MEQDTNREYLKKLLDFLQRRIINKPENTWFVDELRGMLSTHNQHCIQPKENGILNKIEKYLALDYQLDDSHTIIDYSFVKNDYIRKCLDADCREMLRYRYGLRGHIKNFEEFCRFAFMQVERIINAYYNLCGNTMSERIVHLQQFNPKYSPAKDKLPNSIEGIPFNFKLYAFNTELQVGIGVYNIVDRLSKIRNYQSHGATINSDEVLFNEHRDKLSRQGYPLRIDSLVDWNALKNNYPTLYNLYNNTIKNSPEHKRYIEICWQKTIPYDDVIWALNQMVIIARRFL